MSFYCVSKHVNLDLLDVHMAHIAFPQHKAEERARELRSNPNVLRRRKSVSRAKRKIEHKENGGRKLI